MSGNARRRTFSAEDRQRIVREADACAQRGEVGALLLTAATRRTYSSHLTPWRREIEQRNLEALAPKKRGPKVDPRAAEIAELMRENEKLRARAERAELLCEIRK